MEQLNTTLSLAEACGNDAHCVWAGQGLSAGGQAWAHDGAVAVTCPALSCQDRLVVHGRLTAAIHLVRTLIPSLASSYIVLGDASLISALTSAVPRLKPRIQVGWMEAAQRLHGTRSHQVRWLSAGEWPEVSDLLDRAFPDSYARPAVTGVRRWAGIRDGRGILAASAADAWSAPTVGFLAGVSVNESARRRGCGRDVCHFVLEDLLETHGRAGLMVHTWNEPAIRTYYNLGMSWRLLGSAWIDGVGSSRTADGHRGASEESGPTR
jgi:GNAT superfamily N-acetyltransferase